MPIEINCKDIGVTVHILTKELRKILDNHIVNRNVKVFIATHKNLFIFIDDTLEMSILLKNVSELLNRYGIQCELKPLINSGNQELITAFHLFAHNIKNSIINRDLSKH